MAQLTGNDSETFDPVVPLGVALAMLAAVVVAALVAVVFLPTLIIGMATSLFGPQAKAYWDLSRAAGVVAYLMLWASTGFGLLITNKVARLWPGGPAALEMHEFTSLLSLAFIVFHVVILLGDQFIQYTVAQLLVPFGSINYSQFWVAMGQLGFYIALPVTFTFYIRKQIGYRAFRLIHYGSFAMYILATFHGLLAGTDTTNPLMLGMYGVSGFIIYVLFLYRLYVSIRQPRQAPS